MDPLLVTIIVAILAGPGVAFITWFFNHKKYVADIYNTISDSSQTAVETMQMAMQTLHEELNDARQKMNDLMQHQLFLTQKVAEMKEAIMVHEKDKAKLHWRIYELTASLREVVTDSTDSPS